MLQRFRKGNTSVDAKAMTATSWADFEPDEYDGSEDGDDQVHHPKMEPLVPKEKLVQHEKEMKDA